VLLFSERKCHISSLFFDICHWHVTERVLLLLWSSIALTIHLHLPYNNYHIISTVHSTHTVLNYIQWENLLRSKNGITVIFYPNFESLDHLGKFWGLDKLTPLADAPMPL